MLPESHTAIVARNENWTGHAASPPYECGWAREAVFFIRALKAPEGPQPDVNVEISPDGIRWLPEGTRVAMPSAQDEIAVARISNFGNWLRVRADFEDGASSTILVTLHLKA
ncbi:hypothetical protein [Pararhizobium sp. IMCC21322]|uniref:hypothetical protein n=1 Tax=Pararhizobium sp. IMCC21322 TaxID=3067903 RepID=UPI0027420126|nr:hypothetical protein [Pararhizobium sp. IMCC21322]